MVFPNRFRGAGLAESSEPLQKQASNEGKNKNCLADANKALHS